jgi:RNA recognition motif-containing protein
MRPVPFKGNLIVTNLPDDMTAPALADLFEDYGVVIGAVIKQIPANAGPATIGVVALAPDNAVEKAISAIDKTMVGERKIKVGRAKPMPPRVKGAAKPAPRPVSAPSAAPIAVSRPYVAEAFDGKMDAPQPKTARPVVIEYKNRRIIRP